MKYQHKKRIWFLFPALLILPLFRCGIYTQGGTVAKFSPENNFKIAVLDFNQEGFMGGDKLGRFAADELTTALFLKKKCHVIDRSQVRSKMLEKRVSSSVLSANAAQELGQQMGADYLILGKLVRLDETGFEDTENYRVMQITFRVIQVTDGSMVGIVTQQSHVKKELKRVIQDTVNEMAGSVEIKIDADENSEI